MEYRMSAALALRPPVAGRDAMPERGEIVARYRCLREISKRHHHGVLDGHVSSEALLQPARRLGLADGNTLFLDDIDELNYANDLAIYTAAAGRSRAIDRYAQSARFAPGSDEALVLDAMRRARFAVVRVRCRHEVAGLVVEDAVDKRQLWLVDIGLESSVPDGTVLAMRLFAPESFFMATGVSVLLDLAMIDTAIDEVPQLYRKAPAAMMEDRRFAEAIYRVALADGMSERVKYQDPFETIE
jgi:hypothetical protein